MNPEGHVQETTKEEALASARRSSAGAEDEMSISQEILVLDLGDQQEPQFKYTTKLSAKDNYYTNCK